MDRRDDRVAAIVAPAERRLGLPKRCTGSPLARPGRIRPTRLAVGTCSLAPQYAELAPELLAVGSMAVLSIYVRQRGSAEKKPVGSSHESTGGAG